MSVVCGTDFSECAARAARVAAAIAKGLDLPLELVHAIDGPSAALAEARARVGAEAERLRAEIGGRVTARVDSGAPDERLVAMARALGGRLIVVGSLGARRQHHWLLGSVAERVAQVSSVPVLVVRRGATLEEWARSGARKLRVMVGVEPTQSSHAALLWAQGLHAIGPCQLVVARVVWPAEVHERVGLPPPVPLDHLRPELESTLLRELEEWAGESPAPAETRYVVEPGWGRVDSHLTQLASQHEVDLVVVGTHQRALAARIWQGSVSRGVLHGAEMSVACVPSGK